MGRQHNGFPHRNALAHAGETMGAAAHFSEPGSPLQPAVNPVLPGWELEIKKETEEENSMWRGRLPGEQVAGCGGTGPPRASQPQEELETQPGCML